MERAVGNDGERSKIPEIIPQVPRPRIFWKGDRRASSWALRRTGKCGERGCQHLARYALLRVNRTRCFNRMGGIRCAESWVSLHS